VDAVAILAVDATDVGDRYAPVLLHELEGSVVSSTTLRDGVLRPWGYE
jgi:hypothetical protein